MWSSRYALAAGLGFGPRSSRAVPRDHLALLAEVRTARTAVAEAAFAPPYALQGSSPSR